MLNATGNKLYFFSRNSRDNSSDTMEIDFLISKSMITSKHNIIPIEVKSGKNYTYSSLNKLYNKYKDYLGDAIILHTGDLKIENDILYLPIYMTSLLWLKYTSVELKCIKNRCFRHYATSLYSDLHSSTKVFVVFCIIVFYNEFMCSKNKFSSKKGNTWTK